MIFGEGEEAFACTLIPGMTGTMRTETSAKTNMRNFIIGSNCLLDSAFDSFYVLPDRLKTTELNHPN